MHISSLLITFVMLSAAKLKHKTFKKMKNSEKTFVVVYIKGGKTIKLNNESEISLGLLEEHNNSTRAELWHQDNEGKKLIDTIYK